MIGNVSKPTGIKGEKGDTPNLAFRYEEDTGNLYCTVYGVLGFKDYIDINTLATKDFVSEAIKNTSGSTSTPIRAFVNILGGSKNWIPEEVYDSNNNVIGLRYFQNVHVENADGENIDITPNSKIDLQVSSEQMVVFYEKDIAFVAENEEGAVYIYCIGSVPENDYTIQVTVTEVVIDE